MTSTGSAQPQYELPEYAYVTPPELTPDAARESHQVAVIGAGLSGLTLAALLGQYGVRVVVLDEDNTVGVRGASSRAICYSRPTLEVFQRIGIADDVVAAGATWSTGRVYSGNSELFSFELEGGQGLPPFVNIQQFLVEQHLVEQVARTPGVELRWLSKALKIERGPQGVGVQVECPDGVYRLDVDYLVDASGSASTFRDEVSTAQSEEHMPGRWVISDVRFTDPRPSERYTWIDADFNDGRAVWLHKMADDVWRVDFQMTPDSVAADIESPAAVDDRIRRLFGPDVVYSPVWIGSFQTRTFLLDRFRDGRVFVCGDAAHVVPPFGARGGNTGVQDANNLAWKLALVLTGRADETLLDSYQDERWPVAELNRQVTRRSARFMEPRSEAEHVLRRAVLSLSPSSLFARSLVNTGRMASHDRYPAGARIGKVGGSHLDMQVVLGPSGRRATLAQHLVWASGGLLALTMGPGGAQRDALADALSGLPVVVVEAGQESLDVEQLSKERKPQLGDIWLIRPDGVLLDIARSVDEAHQTIGRALGATDDTSPSGVASQPPGSAASGEDASTTSVRDQFYESLVAAHEGLSAQASAELNAALVFVLAEALGEDRDLGGYVTSAQRRRRPATGR